MERNEARGTGNTLNCREWLALHDRRGTWGKKNVWTNIAAFCRPRTKDYFRFDPLLHLRFDGDEMRNRENVGERFVPEEIVRIEQADEERSESLKKIGSP